MYTRAKFVQVKPPYVPQDMIVGGNPVTEASYIRPAKYAERAILWK